MKTTSYNTEKEIRFGILIVVFAMAIFTTIKIKELQLNGDLTSEGTGTDRIVVYHANFPLTVLDARLIEEPALEIENWMTDNNYWSGANVAEAVEAEPALEIENWMTSNTYFTGTNTEKVAEAEPALKIESWMNNSDYWSGNTEDKEKEVALKIESWMNSSAYWTGSEKQINNGNELVNN